jgi:hypothetical protein
MYLTVLLLPLRLRCLFRLQATEEEAAAAERRIQEPIEAKNAAKAQLAMAQLVRIDYTHITRAAVALHRDLCALLSPLLLLLHPPMQPLGFALEGHPTPAFNGAYRKVSEHKGWPVLRNGTGKFCYRYEPNDEWLLSDKHTPDEDAATSWIASAEGPLSIGAQTWRCYVDGEWVDRSLSVTVLVRPFPSLMLSASVCILSGSLSHAP